MGEAVITDGGASGAAASGSGSASPATFADASWADASPASDTSGQTTTPPAAAQPGSPEATPTPDDRSPFIPRARFDEVNGRLKTAEAWKQQYGWAEQIPQADLQQALDIARQASADPVAYVQTLIAELQAHPTHGAALRSLAAKALAAGRGQSANAMPEPDVAITDADGNVVGQTYSAAMLAKRDEWLTQQVLAKVDERYAPTRETAEQIKQQAQAAKDLAAGQQFATDFTSELKELYPTFDQHKTAIGQDVVRQLAKLPAGDPRGNDPAYLESITLRAAQRIIGGSTRSQAESAVLDSLKQKAAASSAVHPHAATASTPKRIDSFNQLTADAWR